MNGLSADEWAEFEWLATESEAAIEERWAAMDFEARVSVLDALDRLDDGRLAKRLGARVPRLPVNSFEDAIEWECEIVCDQHLSQARQPMDVLLFTFVGLAQNGHGSSWSFKPLVFYRGVTPVVGDEPLRPGEVPPSGFEEHLRFRAEVRCARCGPRSRVAVISDLNAFGDRHLGDLRRRHPAGHAVTLRELDAMLAGGGNREPNAARAGHPHLKRDNSG